jgi:magnesium transporter
MTAGVQWGVDLGMPEIAPIAFVLTNERLITTRYAEPRVFKMLQPKSIHNQTCATLA